jgi:hypothetical protein
MRRAGSPAPTILSTAATCRQDSLVAFPR